MGIESTCDHVVRILFLIKLQMAVEVEPELPGRLGGARGGGTATGVGAGRPGRALLLPARRPRLGSASLLESVRSPPLKP